MSWYARLGRALEDPGSGAPRGGSAVEAGRLATAARLPAASVRAARPIAVAASRATRPVAITTVRPLRGVGSIRAKALLAARPPRGIVVANDVPAPRPVDPVRADDALLFPNAETGSALYLALRPHGLGCSIVFRAAEQGGSVSLAGASVTVTCTGLPLLTPEQIGSRRDAWVRALADAGHGHRAWRFSPLQVRSVRATLDLPTGHADAPASATVNADTVDASLVLDLTASGARAWRQAADAARWDTVAGTLSLELGYAVERPEGGLQARRTTLVAPLGQVLVDGEVVHRTVEAEVGVTARVLVRGGDSIERVAVTMMSDGGTEAVTVGPEGGEVTTALTTSDPATAEVRWTAEVSYAAPEWPVVTASGALSAAQGWARIVAPWSWVRTVDVLTMLVDAEGVAVPEPGPHDTVVGSAVLRASYLGRPLETSFQGRHQQLTTLHLPWPPTTDAAELELSALVLRDGRQSLATHVLSEDARWLVIAVAPDATVTFTSESAVAESSREGDPRAADARLLRSLLG